VENWNKFTEHVVSSGTVNTFKNRFGQIIRSCLGLYKSIKAFFPLALSPWITFSDGITLNHVKSPQFLGIDNIRSTFLHFYNSYIRTCSSDEAASTMLSIQATVKFFYLLYHVFRGLLLTGKRRHQH